MKYFAISQEEASGAPLGFLNGALYDKYYVDAKPVEYGFFPWYAEGRSSRPHSPYPQGMVFITKDKHYDFDIRGVASFYMGSDEFVSICSRFNTLIQDCIPIDVVSAGNRKISSVQYNAIYIGSVDVRDYASAESTFFEEEGIIFRIKKMTLKKTVGFDLFRFEDLIAGSGTLICSERFAEAAANLKGVKFIPLDSVTWSQVRRI